MGWRGFCTEPGGDDDDPAPFCALAKGALLANEEVEMLTILRINRKFMEYMRANFSEIARTVASSPSTIVNDDVNDDDAAAPATASPAAPSSSSAAGPAAAASSCSSSTVEI